MRPRRTIGLLLALAAFPASSALAQVTRADLNEVFAKLDANGDKVVERGEVLPKALPGFEKLLKAGDTDGDGKLQLAEVRKLAATFPGGPAGGGGGGGVFAGDPVARFKAMDKDNDGKVSRAEFPGRPMVFDRLDANKDGFIDREELKALPAVAAAFPAPIVGGGGAAALVTRIGQMDKDNDGKVSRAEFTGVAAMFGRYDADKDGSISRAEAAKAPAVMIETLHALDLDGSKSLSREEFRGEADAFDRLDLDKDGSISFAEIARAFGPAKGPDA